MSKEENINDNNLKEIRKEKGLSLSEVSDRLKLNKNVINKLESSQFKELGAFTYVRGYINHYAKLLDVDPQKYIDLIPKTELEVPFVNTGSQFKKGIKLKRQSKKMASYLMGTFVVIAISLSGWFLLKNYFGMNKIVSSTIEISQDIGKENNTENLSEATPENTGLAIQSEEVPDEENYHYSSLIPSDEQNPVNNIELNENQIIIPEKQTATDAIVDENLNEKINKLSYEIIIKASETSWLKIEKKDGTKLHNKLLEPGQFIVQSDEPVHFRIGNGDSVKVSINGKNIDLSQYTIKNIADFNWPQDN